MEDHRNTGRAIFDRQFDHITRLVHATARRKRLSAEEEDELYSQVMLKIIDDDFALLRAFRHRASWPTYLSVIIQRVLLDHRTREWGRWRPCVQARRLGPHAIWLDQRINRDGRAPEEAVTELSRLHPEQSVSDIQRLADQIPRRSRRRFIHQDEHLERIPSPTLSDDHVEAAQRRRSRGTLHRVLQSALRELQQGEFDMLRLRFGHGWTVRRIAQRLGLQPRSLYTRFDRIKRQLRRHLEQHGIIWEDVEGLLGQPELDLDLHLDIGLRSTGSE